jgi:uncharacterized protein
VVNQGQFLERPAIIAVGDCVLDGLWHRGAGRPPLLIIPPPPNQGSMHHPVLAELAWAAATSGFPTLRFDFRGVGASQGAPRGPAERLTDAEAALRLLEENTGVARAALASFGASAETLLALHRLHSSIAGLCFVSPAGLSTSELALPPVPVIAIVGGRDGSIAPPAWAPSISEARGQLEIIPAADRNFDRNLPEVGKALVRWLLQLQTP